MITTMPSDQNGPPPRVEVITSVQRRRRWPTAEKIRLVEETMQPGMSVSYVARPAGVAPSLLFNWRRRMLEGGLRAVEADEDVVGTDECGNWSACSVARPWKSRFSRKRLMSRG